MTATRPRLSRSDWTDAALAAMASQGAAGINVEQLARDLGSTKGSFYHHFENRQELLEATLDRFVELVAIDIAEAGTVTDPRDALVQAALSGVGSQIDGFVDLALAASADDPVVAATLKRINTTRLDFLAGAIEQLGIDPQEARRRAEAGLATYLGIFHLQRVQGRRFSDEHLRDHIVRAVDHMCAPE